MPIDTDIVAEATQLHIDLDRPNVTGICPCGKRYYAGYLDREANPAGDEKGTVLHESPWCEAGHVEAFGLLGHPTRFLRWAREHGSNPQRIG